METGREQPRKFRPARTIMTRSQSAGAPNFFSRMPLEVLHMVLDQLSVLELSVFSMASKEISGYVVDYVSSLAWKKKIILQNTHHTMLPEDRSTVEHYRHLGLLFKRCTLLLPTRIRLKFVFSTFSQIPCFKLEKCIVPHCTGFSRYGIFLQTLIAGWDELECRRVLNLLCQVTNLMQKTQAVIIKKPGVMQYQEMQLRLFCRHVLLDQCQNQSDFQFWLTQLLKPWALVSQAHLLFILYGPLLPEGPLGWQAVVECGLPHSALWDISRAILILSGGDWTSEFMLSILEELTAIPEPWHVENVASLLVLSGSNLCYRFLASKVSNRRVTEVSNIIIYIILVCEKEGYHMSWAVALVQRICRVFTAVSERFGFLLQLENAFSQVTRELLEFSVAGNQIEHREAFRTVNLLLDSSAHFHARFLHMLNM